LDRELQRHEQGLRAARAAPDEVVQRTVAEFERRVADPGETGAAFVAVADDGEVLGYLSIFVEEDQLERDPAVAYIDKLVVTRSPRRVGVGQARIAAAQSFAAEQQVRRLIVKVLHNNVHALSAYRYYGFTEDAIVLERRLII